MATLVHYQAAHLFENVSQILFTCYQYLLQERQQWKDYSDNGNYPGIDQYHQGNGSRNKTKCLIYRYDSIQTVMLILLGFIHY